MRNSHLKIPDIKVFRSLTNLLGKLGIKECRRTPHPTIHPITMKPISPVYGLGLKEAKDLVERIFNYQVLTNSPSVQLRAYNEIHQIKRTRQLMVTLNKLGLKAPDSSLQPCRQFVARLRR